MYSTKKISAYEEFGEHLVADQCQRISQIGHWDTNLDSYGGYIHSRLPLFLLSFSCFHRPAPFLV